MLGAGVRGFSWVLEGRLGGMGRPGAPLRNLVEDLAFLSEKGIRAVVALTEEGLDEDTVETQGFAYLHVPIPDFTAPTMTQIQIVVGFVDRSLEASMPVAIHCAAGLGRTGSILACYLVSRGASADEAITRVRAARPGSIETAEQVQVVKDYASSGVGARS